MNGKNPKEKNPKDVNVGKGLSRLGHVKFSDYPKEYENKMKLNKLEKKLKKCISNHFVNIEHNANRKYLKHVINSVVRDWHM